MIHKIKSFTAAALAAVFLLAGCQQNIETPAEKDTTPPAEVTALTAQAGSGKIALSWKNPADDDLYQVEITANPAHGSLKYAVCLAAEKGKEANYIAEGLTNGTAYTFTIKTIDKSLNKSAGKTTESAVTPVSTSDTTPPAEVTVLTAQAGRGKIALSWKNPADDDLYQVEITANPAHGSLKTAVYLAAEKGKVVSYSADGLNADTEYTFTVKTVDKALNKSAGVSKTARTQTVPVPGAPMVVTLTQSPATPTNGNVTVSVSSSTSVKTAKWSPGIKTVDEVLANGTDITGNSFTLSENGTYTVAVMDTDGRREIKTITIGNIDKTPPAKVQNLSASYASGSGKITVTWTNPTDADFVGSVLRWKKGAESETAVERSKTDTSYEISPVPADDSVYAISVTTKDELGNESGKESVTVRSTLNAEVTAISLDRTHLDTIMTNRSVAVTVTGSNLDRLTDLLVRVTDGHTAETAVMATIDVPHNTATATVTAPVPARPTEAGTVYTVEALLNSAIPAQATASFIVSKPAEVKEIILSPEKIKFGSASSVSVTVKGANFDIRGETKIKLLDSEGREVSASTVTVAPDVGTASEFTASVPLPSESGVFTVALYFDGKKDAKTADVQLYGDPVITKVSIPCAGISYAGNKIPVTIVGKNFTAPGISAAYFSGTGAIFSNFKVVSDILATAEVSCPYTAREYPVTVHCKNASKTGTITVKDYSLWTPGKIVLADKTVVDKALYTAIDPANPPIAVVCRNLYGIPFGVALHKGNSLPWAEYNTTSYATQFEGIVCTPSQTESGAALTATFTGDTDGSDNWDYICSVDPEGTANAAVNYPAFNWVNTYNETYKSKLGAARPAWYMPSIAELCELYKNKEVINASLLKINGLNSAYADANFGTGDFWSSSQCSDYYNSAWRAGFGSGYLGNFYSKYSSYDVCCIAGF
ncbi:DUF4959 domain-containing protein [Treponema socranskii]|uniref:DUF4959 domain-containing protein n=1 Tax=Treponema socranskii TaxID=53419 RepID=UPI0028EF2D9C|nr:DUF4959 domain-containing protein [Treponema socranskii]